MSGFNPNPFCPESQSHQRDTCNHILDKIPPRQVLSKCFQSFGCCCRLVGILPITINPDGSAHFRLISKQVVHTLVYITLFVTTSIIYLPAYFKQNSKLKSDAANYISENLFVGGQLAGVVLTMIQIPWLASRTALFWNKLLPLVEYIVAKNYCYVFRMPYLRSRLALLIHIIFVFIYSIICWRDFATGGKIRSFDKASIIYWLHAFGLLVFFFVCFLHLLPCMILKMFVALLSQAFLGIRGHVEDLVGKQVQLQLCNLSEKAKPLEGSEEIREAIAIYEKLCELCHEIGNAMGFYLLVELVVLMTSVLMNVFTMLSQFEQRDAWSTCFGFVAYIGLLIAMTEGGEMLQAEGRRCLHAIRNAMYAMDNRDPLLLHKLNCLTGPKLTAANCFTINRRLAIGMGSTFATYFVVMLQFKLNIHKRNDCES